MTNLSEHSTSILRNSLRGTNFALILLGALTIVALPTAQAQTFSLLHTFTGGQDGSRPDAGLTMDKAGNLYGTAYEGGSDNLCGFGCGTVFKLSHKGSGWVFTPLYSFAGGSDGYAPLARVIFGPDGSLYGTTVFGGIQACSNGQQSCGTVFNLKPGVSACKAALCPWTETVLHRFSGGTTDGANPFSEATFDPAGNMYVATVGDNGSGPLYGNVVKLTPSGSGWTSTVLYSFTGGTDGANVVGNLTLDAAGNIYGVTEGGGAYGHGVVFRLTPSGSGWSDNVLYSFQDGSDGSGPQGGVIFDASGNLYGGTGFGGTGNGGTVFALSPANGEWTLTTLYSFRGPGIGPDAPLTMDSSGNLFGTTYSVGGHGSGSAFRLTPLNGGWIYTDLHDFTGGDDGELPESNLVFDSAGNLYGTAYSGGKYLDGVAFEITP